MSRTRVRDMSRNQQKAVFANLGSDEGYLRRLESAEQFHRRREYLINKADLAETTEDKIFRVMNDKTLSHRQKMDRIAKIKEDAKKKLKKLQNSETKPLAATELRGSTSSPSELVKIEKVPAGLERGAFDSFVMKNRLPKGTLIEHKGLLLTQDEYVQSLKNSMRVPSGSRITPVPREHGKRKAFDAIVLGKKVTLKRNDFFRLDNRTVVHANVYVDALKRRSEFKGVSQESPKKRFGVFRKTYTGKEDYIVSYSTKKEAEKAVRVIKQTTPGKGYPIEIRKVA